MSRYHVYTEARHPTGAVAAGHSLHVYDDADGTVTSSIYAASSGGSPRANPYVVPATGIVDFWATVPAPYVVASGDTTPRILPIVVAVPADIGAAGVAASNAFTADQTISGHRLLITPGAMLPGSGEWGHIEIDSTAPETVSCLGLKHDGVNLAQVCTDPYAFVVCMQQQGQAQGVVEDRFGIGIDNPHRMIFGAISTPQIGDAGTPFFTFTADNPSPTETAFQLNLSNPQTGPAFCVHNPDIEGPLEGVDILTLDPTGNLDVAGDIAGLDILPVANTVATYSKVGGPGRAYLKMYLHDGTEPYAVTVAPGGTLTATKLQKNYCTNPNCTAAKLDIAGAGATTTRETAPPVALPAGFTACTKVVHASGAYQAGTLSEFFAVTPGGVYRLSGYVHAAAVAGGDFLALAYVTMDGVTIRRDQTVSVTVDAVNASFVRVSASITIAADEDSLSGKFWLATGTGTYYFTGFLLEESADLNAYWDGDSTDCGWAAAANASISYKG